MKSFTLYRSNTRGNTKNVYYNIECKINSLEDLKAAVKYDHIPCKCKNNYREKDSFQSADLIEMDIDNDHSDDPEDWKEIDDISDAFPDVDFYYIESRNHMKPKTKDNGEIKEPRPKYHIYFPIEKTSDPERYRQIKTYIGGMFPYFDSKCVDITHFFFGVEDPKGGERE